MKTTPSRILAAVLALPALAGAANYEWTFNDGTLGDAFGNGAMTPAGATVPSVVFTDGATIPHIGGVQGRVLNVPAFSSQLDGFNLSLNATGPNGGGAFINQYTFIFDIFSPGAGNWQAIFNTDPTNGNDADWYIAPDNSLGIGATGYTAPGSVTQNAWHRLTFAADLGAGQTKYYIDGNLSFTWGVPPQTDGRFSLYSNNDPGVDVRLFNEGDSSGIYTHAMYVNSVSFVDRKMSDAEIAALGAPSAGGILVPEPATGLLALLGLTSLASRRRR